MGFIRETPGLVGTGIVRLTPLEYFFRVLFTSTQQIQFSLVIQAGSWQNKLLHTYNYKNKRKTSENEYFA